MEPEIALEELKEKIELFLLDHPHPVLTEPGREVMDISASNYSLSTQYGKLLWHIWNEHANLVRQITGLQKEKPDRLELRFQRFGKGPPGTLILTDSRARPEQLERRSLRTQYARMLRRWLIQLFPQWKVEALSSEADWAHSLSGRYARGLLVRGQQAWAVVGTGEQEDPSAAEDSLTYGLIWLDWARRQNPSRVVEGLKIFVPLRQAATTCQRLAWMNSELARWEVYETAEEARLCDLKDVGNLRTSLPPFRESPALPPALEGWIEQIRALSPDVEARRGADGLWTWAVRGLAFARQTSREVVFGLGRAETALREETFGELQELVNKILHLRRPDSPDPAHPCYRLQPERWMQSILRRELDRISPDLIPGEVYEQVPAVSGMERGLMDLLAVNAQGRLVVMELKASEDIHLPLQALDYWMRVHWHHQRGEFERQRYFAGRALSPQTPLLLLVCPALQFHPTCEIILRYFAPSIEVVRIGLNENWREQTQVVFRAARQAGRMPPA